MSRVRAGKPPVVNGDAMKTLAAQSVAIASPDDREYGELTGVADERRGRLIQSARDADGGELDMLRRRIDALEAAHNAAAWEINLHNKFLTEFRAAFGKMLFYPFYRFIVWMMPIPLPPYKQGKTVPYIVRADRRPTYGGE